MINTVLRGATYKIKPPYSLHSFYITIAHKIVEGKRVPVRLFINSKHMPTYQWTEALIEFVSDALEKGMSPIEAAKTLQDVCDPAEGEYFIPKTNIKVKSLVAHVGYILENHLVLLESENIPWSCDNEKEDSEEKKDK